MSDWWMRCFRRLRWRTRWSRKRARSRAPRTSGSGSQIAWHELAPRELGQDPGVDPVGLAGKRGEPLGLLRVCDLDLPAASSSWSCTKRAPFHRLDRGANQLPVAFEPQRQTVKAVGVKRHRADVDRRALIVKEMEVETLATEIQTGVQHRSGPPLR
jgi:hypothetical protein